MVEVEEEVVGANRELVCDDDDDEEEEGGEDTTIVLFLCDCSFLTTIDYEISIIILRHENSNNI